MNEKKYIRLVPIILFILIVPLVVRIKILDFPIENLLWSNYPPRVADLFTYYKGIVIIISAVMASLILLKMFFLEKNKIKFDKYKKMILISSLFIGIVTLLSKYKFIAIRGDISRAEGAFVLISYLIMTVYIGEVIKEKKELKIILYGIYILGAILGLIGLFQYMGKDIFDTALFQKLYLAEGITRENLNFKMNGRIFMTLFNPNYVGSFAALIYTFSLNMIIRRKKIIEKFFWSLQIILMFIALEGSLSEAGFIGVFVGSLATLVINYKLIIHNKKKLLIFFIIFFTILGGGYNKYKDNRYISSIRGTFTGINKKVETPLKSITTENSRIIFNYDNDNYEFILDKNNPEKSFDFYRDGKAIDVEINDTDNKILIKDDVSENIQISFFSEIGKDGYKIVFDGRAFHFLIDNDEILYRNSIRKLVSLDSVDYVKAFEGYEHLGSGRFYIWSRSIPLLKRTWLVGFGPDHFAYNFPQTDYVGKNMKNMRMVNTVVDKPHNMYLQYAINIGVVPLLILLAFWFMLLYELFKIVQKEELDDIYLTVAAAAFSSIIGFMAVGMFNDSTVNVSSIFWGIVGLGLAVVNYNRYDHIRFKKEN